MSIEDTVSTESPGDTGASHGHRVVTALWNTGCAAAVLVFVVIPAIGVIGAMPTWTEHRRTPEPRGLVLQLELRESASPLERWEFLPIERDGPAVAILDHGASAFPKTLTVARHPSGELPQRIEPATDADFELARAARRTKSSIAFDFDGIGDEFVTGGDARYGRGLVLSGVDGRELWSDEDPLEYESNERLTPLGDLDGDGCSELAVWHPRYDRSDYDTELVDAIFGAKRWLSIVSGARATR
ncbi:MAG: hypothetical protein HZA52_11745 [Planctomycetes bacterium]|nr:hypothetical protein [Planctomycetota bacterium]